MATLRGDINRLPDEMRERLLPYLLQLGRLSAAVGGDHNGSLGQPRAALSYQRWRRGATAGGRDHHRSRR